MYNKSIFIVLGIIFTSFVFTAEFNVKNFKKSLDSIGTGNYKQRKENRLSFTKLILDIVNSDSPNILIDGIDEFSKHPDPEVRYQSRKILNELFTKKEFTNEAIRLVVSASNLSKEFYLKHQTFEFHKNFLAIISTQDKLNLNENTLNDFFIFYLQNHIVEYKPALDGQEIEKTSILLYIMKCINSHANVYNFIDLIVKDTSFNDSEEIVKFLFKASPQDFFKYTEYFFLNNYLRSYFYSTVDKIINIEKKYPGFEAYIQKYINSIPEEKYYIITDHFEELINLFIKINKLNLIEDKIVTLLASRSEDMLTRKNRMISALYNKSSKIEKINNFDTIVPDLIKIIADNKQNNHILLSIVDIYPLKLIFKYSNEDPSNKIKKLQESLYDLSNIKSVAKYLMITNEYINIYKKFNPVDKTHIPKLVHKFINTELKEFFLKTYSKDVIRLEENYYFYFGLQKAVNGQLYYLNRILSNTETGKNILVTLLSDRDSLNLSRDEISQQFKYVKSIKDQLSEEQLESFNEFAITNQTISKEIINK